MRTKTLLIAVAALSATVISSEAQVFSQNVVGYVNVVVPQSPAWACLANPFDYDGTDNITNVLAGVPKQTTIELFSAIGGFNTIVTKNAAGNWSANAATTFVPPGVGFMIKNSTAAFTNTFVGTVIPNLGGTNALTLTDGVLQLVGSPTAYSGTLTNAADTGPGTLNLGASLPNLSQIQTWNNGFSLAASRLATGKWNANPTFSVAQGFFVKPGGSGTTNWVQTLP